MGKHRCDKRPLAIDIFTGLHGWAEGLIAEGWRVIGFDIEDMSAKFGYPKPDHFRLVLQDVLTLHGSQFRDAELIVASPPCQAYSYRAMPWKRAKALPPPDNALFDACWRIQHQACEAAGRHIPLIIENVRGAIPWVGRSRWNFGSYHLWGDVPALMPATRGVLKPQPTEPRHGTGSWFAIDMKSARAGVTDPREITGSKIGGGAKVEGIGWTGFADTGASWRNREALGTKVPGHAFDGRSKCFAQAAVDGLKFGGGWWHDTTNNLIRKAGSGSTARKRASAMIARIPLPLSRHIGRTFYPAETADAA